MTGSKNIERQDGDGIGSLLSGLGEVQYASA